MTDEPPKIYHRGDCEAVEPKIFLQIRPSYDGMEELQEIWYCPECGRYAEKDFEGV